MGRPARVTRDQVLRAAREAFAQRGYDGTTLADIAARVGLSPAAILRHAPSKASLFTAAMSSAPPADLIPIQFLENVSGSEDPRLVLRRVARAFIPFMESRFGEQIARWQFQRAGSPAPASLSSGSPQSRPLRSGLPRSITLPFDPAQRPTPPERALDQLESYLRRAGRAGRIRVRDPRSAALSFLGSLHAYVFFHRILDALDPPLPLP